MLTRSGTQFLPAQFIGEIARRKDGHPYHSPRVYKVTRDGNIVADGWAVAYNLPPYPKLTCTHIQL